MGPSIDTQTEDRQMFNHSDYSVKGLKTFRGVEGTGFEATLYRGSKRIATVVDDGWGGCHKWYWMDESAEEEALLSTHIAALPAETCDFEGTDGKPFVYKMDDDGFVSGLVGLLEDERRAKRTLNRVVMYVRKDGKVYSINKKKHDETIIRSSIADKADLIVNDLPLADAIERFGGYM